MWCDTTAERWYVDLLFKYFIMYRNAYWCIDHIFVLFLLAQQLYVDTENSIG